MIRRGAVLRLLARGPRPDRRRPVRLARQLAAAAGLSLVAAIVIELILLPGRWYLPFGQLWLVVTAALLVQWTVGGVPEPAAMAGLAAADRPVPAGPPAQPFPLVDRWAQRLWVPSGDPERFGPVARDRLAALVAERLRQRHGVRLADPRRARSILGDELYAFLTGPLTRTPTPAELGRLITRMEEI